MTDDTKTKTAPAAAEEDDRASTPLVDGILDATALIEAFDLADRDAGVEFRRLVEVATPMSLWGLAAYASLAIRVAAHIDYTAPTKAEVLHDLREHLLTESIQAHEEGTVNG